MNIRLARTSAGSINMAAKKKKAKTPAKATARTVAPKKPKKRKQAPTKPAKKKAAPKRTPKKGAKRPAAPKVATKRPAAVSPPKTFANRVRDCDTGTAVWFIVAGGIEHAAIQRRGSEGAVVILTDAGVPEVVPSSNLFETAEEARAARIR